MTAVHTIAYSPCPNDTFVFHAWAHGLLPDAPPLRVTLADIDRTNVMATQGTHDVLKISYAALPWVLDEYALLPAGGALGRGCGPLLLTRPGVSTLVGKRVAVPSERSTAYLLFRLWARQAAPSGLADIQVLPFADIMPAVRDGKVDAGLVIHEARFTFGGYGLTAHVDLGEWWESETGLPIPLGAIIARRSLDLSALAAAARASVEHAWAHPDQSAAYVAAHAAEMDIDVQHAHINLYVNEFTRDLGAEGRSAVRGLLSRAAEAGLTPPVPSAALT